MGALGLQRLWEEVGWPEGGVVARGLGRPGPLRIAIEAMDKDDIYLGTWVAVDRCDVEAGDLFIDSPLNGPKSENKALT